jgi:voltage-gated potassium channel
VQAFFYALVLLAMPAGNAPGRPPLIHVNRSARVRRDDLPMKKWHRRWRPGARRGLAFSLALCMLLMSGGGIGFWLLEPRAHTLGEGLWLAFTTAATVGYGDIVPSTDASRAFAMFIVLVGLAVLSMVTASVAAIFVGTEERQIERDLLKEIASLRAEVRAIADRLPRDAETRADRRPAARDPG